MAKKAAVVRKVKREVKEVAVKRDGKTLTKDEARRESMKAQGLIHRRRKRQSVRPGMQMGELYIIQRVATKQGSSGGQKWSCECSCGKRLVIPQWYLMRKEFPKRHCGCIQTKKKNPFQRERGIWYMMHRRCYNSSHVAYKHYGGANPPIGVCDSWNKDIVGVETAFANFIKDMGKAPTKGHTLDRINPYRNYGWIKDSTGLSEGLILNCRWATHSEQMNNLKRHWKKPEELEEIVEAEQFDIVDDDEEEGDGDV